MIASVIQYDESNEKNWWVNQRGHFFFEETKLGCIWAPKKNARGRTPFHWQTLTKVKPNDIIFKSEKENCSCGIAISKTIRCRSNKLFRQKNIYLKEEKELVKAGIWE